jgi:uncharacterized protein with GYD domain
MAKFAVFFRFKGESIKAMMEHPSDRAEVVSRLCEAAGARMEAYYLMFGEWDGFVIVEGSDSGTAAAVSLAVSSTHELRDSSEFADAVQRGAGLTYTPPGA